MQKESLPLSEKVMPLTFGAIISFSPTDSNDSFVHVDGFVKDRVLIKKFDNFESKLLYSQCLFQIYPAFLNTYKKEAIAFKDGTSTKSNTKGRKRLDMINGLQNKVVTEFNFNLETFKKVAGQPVLFGQTVQLLHVTSNKFLTLTSSEAELEKENYKIGLDEFSSEATTFKFLPCYKHQKESEGIIYLDDRIYIATTNLILNKISHLHLSNPTAVKVQQHEALPHMANGLAQIAGTGDTQSKYRSKIEVNASIESQSRFKLNYFTKYHPEMNSFLECGDIVWLNHSETNSSLVCITEFRNKVFEHRVEFDLSSKVTDNYKPFLGNTNGMWILENSSYQKGGPVRWDQSYRFKHLGSGEYLSVQKGGKKTETGKIFLERYPTEDNLFTLVPVAGNHAHDNPMNRQFVTKDTFVLVKHTKSELVIQAHFDKGSKKKAAENIEEGRLFRGETEPVLVRQGVGSEEAAIKIIRANYNEVWETSFLISSLPMLTGFLETITDMKYRARTDRAWILHLLKKMKAARKCVQDLDLFCKNELFNTSPDQKFGEVNSFRQKLLQEQFFIDALAMILQETLSGEDFKLYEKSKSSDKPLEEEQDQVDEDNLLEERPGSRHGIQDDQLKSEREKEKEKNEKENIQFIDRKVKFCKTIYSLLVSICKGNAANELYTFQLIPKFLIHCKYIPEAVDCVISIIGSNEMILTKMSENLKLDIDKTIDRPLDANVINVVINIKDNENLVDTSQKIRPNFFKGNDKFRISKPINLINFFLNMLKNKNEGTPKGHYLSFLRKICSHNKIGLTINQDIIWKIFHENPKFAQSTLVSFRCQNEDILVELPSTMSQINNIKSFSLLKCYNESQDLMNSYHLNFLEEQIRLYSDLTLSRNYLWKAFLEETFPLPFVFKRIWDARFPKSMRAALCTLALTLHIDHEPYNQLNLPNMCRIYKGNSKRKQSTKSPVKLKSLFLKNKVASDNISLVNHDEQEKIVVEKTQTEEQLFELVENILSYLKQQASAISGDLDKAAENQKAEIKAGERGQLLLIGEDAYDRERLNDVLLLNVMQLFSKLIKFDVLRMTEKPELFSVVVKTFTTLLDYDPKTPVTGYLLNKLRNENLKKREEKLKSNNPMSISCFKRFFSSVIENVTEITGTLGGFLNLTHGSSDDNTKKTTVDQIEDQNYANNPTMRTMMSLHYNLERLKIEEEAKDRIDIEVKLEILDTFNFLLDMRKNYLVTNFLAWHQKLESKMAKYTKPEKQDKFDKKFTEKLNKALYKILPPIARTGIIEVDEIVKKTEDTNKKFKNYAKESEDMALDLDSLLVGEDGKNGVVSDMLPSLLVTFLTTKDSELENKALDIVMRLFNQRKEMMEALQKLEILFNPTEIKSYNYVQKKAARLKYLTERLEIWMEEFLREEDASDEEISEVMEILDNLILLFNPHNQVDENKVIEGDSRYRNEVSLSRQNIMSYLKVYQPALSISREGLHAFSQVILSDEVSVEKKKFLVSLFTKVHIFLKQFCKGNENNQMLLAEHKEMFLLHAHLDMGQIDLLCEIFKANKWLCENISESFLEKFVSLIENEGRQANFLKFFLVIQRSKDTYILENQIRVFRTLISNDESDREKTNKVLYVTRGLSGEEAQFQFEDFLVSSEKRDLIDKLQEYAFQDTYRDEPFNYHEQLLCVLIETMKGAEGLNMYKAKLTNLFSFQYLIELLMAPDAFIMGGDEPNQLKAAVSEQIEIISTKVISNLRPAVGKNQQHQMEVSELNQKGFSKIKKRLVDFIREIYFTKNTNINEEILHNLQFIIKVIDKERNRLDAMTENTIYDPDFVEYFFGSFLNLCNLYISMFLNQKFLQESGHRKDNLALYKLANVIVKKLEYFTDDLTGQQMDNVKTFLQHYLDNEETNYEKVVGFVERNLKPKERRDSFFSIINDLNEEEEPEQGHDKYMAWGSNKCWERIMNILENGQVKWDKAIENENRALSQAILNFSKLFSAEDLEKYKVSLTSSDLIKKLIKYLQFGSSNKAKKETMICTLETLMKMVDVEDPKEKAEVQNMLDKSHATKMFLIVMSDSSIMSMNQEVFNSFLKLGISLLEGGNSRIQRNIHQYCITFQKSEALFAKLYAVITTFSDRLKRLNPSATIGGELREFAEEYSNLGPVILENTLRLLQLFTEGHFTDLQNYIRTQTNSRNNYDMVSAVTDLLRSYLNHMSQANYESIMRCLETLAEFVQGPCPENQMSLIDGKFFEVVNFILTYKNKSGKLKLSKSTSSMNRRMTKKQSFLNSLNQRMEKWMIARLKFKTLVLIMSLLEMRKDATVIKRILRSLSVDVVKKNIAKVWKVYKSIYGTKYVQESLGHYEGDPLVDSKPKKNSKQKYGYYDLITEAGFTSYFLLENYYEVLDIDDDKRVLNSVIAKRKLTPTQKGNFIQTSIIGQIMSFLLSIAKQGLDTADALKNQINKNIIKLGLNEKEGEKLRKEIMYRDLLREGLKFFAEHSAHIEVVRNKEIEKVYFYLQPYCHSLPKEVKIEFNQNVNRVSVQSKVNGLMKSSEDIIQIMEHEHRLKLFFNKYKVIAIFANHVKLWQSLSFSIALVVNFFILASYSSQYGEETDMFEKRLNNPRLFLLEDMTNTPQVLDALGVVMLVSTIFVVLFYLFKKAPLVMDKVWNNPEQNKEKKKRIVSRILNWIFKVILVCFEMLKSIEILYYVSYLVMAALAVIIHPFFFAFHLTETIIRYPVLKSVLRSFWDPRKALGLALVLFVILEYIASLVSFVAFHDQYLGNCESTYNCFMYSFDFTFKANGGIGGHLDDIYERPAGEYTWGRFLFDNIFNLFLVVVVVSIVAGIITDTFGSLREEEDEMNNDIDEHCFICGNEKETFDRKSDAQGGFIEHIKIDHYMWNYIFFVAYLNNKDHTDYTGVESYISEKISFMDVSWFPLRKALVLENVKDEEEQQAHQMEQIQENIESTLSLTSKFSKNLKQTVKRLGKQLNKTEEELNLKPIV